MNSVAEKPSSFNDEFPPQYEGDLAQSYDHDAERALVGSALVAPNTDTSMPAEWFFLSKHRRIWKAINQIKADGGNPDNVTLGAKLGSKLDDVGGEAYLTSLIVNTQ